MERLGAKSLRVAMSDQPWTFRMGVYKPYKMHRSDKRRPLGLKQLRQYLTDEHAATFLPGLEADDLMGLWMTDKYKANGIIVSWDKDMRAVPGRFWVPGTDDVETRNEHQANLMWMAQALSGDAADGYPGCKNIGVVRAFRIVCDAVVRGMEKYGQPHEHELATEMLLQTMWECAKAEFLKKGHTEEDALVSARLARILRHGDYDLRTKEVRLWTPPGDRSSSPSTLTPPALAKARARKSSSTSRTKRSSPAIWSPSRSPSGVQRAKSYPRVGHKKRFVNT